MLLINLFYKHKIKFYFSGDQIVILRDGGYIDFYLKIDGEKYTLTSPTPFGEVFVYDNANKVIKHIKFSCSVFA